MRLDRNTCCTRDGLVSAKLRCCFRFKVVLRCSVAIKHKQEVIKTQAHNGQGGCQCAGTLRLLVLNFLFLPGRDTARLNSTALWPAPPAARSAFYAFSCLGCSDTVISGVVNGCAQPRNTATQNHSPAGTYSARSGSFVDRHLVCPAV